MFAGLRLSSHLLHYGRGSIIEGRPWLPYFILIFLLSCSSTTPSAHSGLCKIAQSESSAWVVGHGWHSGLLLPSEPLRDELGELLPEIKKYPYVEVGWGDERYYMGEVVPLISALRAALFSSGSVIQVVGVHDPAQLGVGGLDSVALELSPEALRSIAQRIGDDLRLGSKVLRVGDSLYGQGSFYRSNLKFSINYTCNSWLSDLLQQAGCRVTRTRYGSKLLRQLRNCCQKDLKQLCPPC